MKISTPEGTELITVTAIEPFEDGIAISGTIMGAMPMKGVLRPSELRAVFKLVSFKLILRTLVMLLRR